MLCHAMKKNLWTDDSSLFSFPEWERLVTIFPPLVFCPCAKKWGMLAPVTQQCRHKALGTGGGGKPVRDRENWAMIGCEVSLSGSTSSARTFRLMDCWLTHCYCWWWNLPTWGKLMEKFVTTVRSAIFICFNLNLPKQNIFIPLMLKEAI